MEGIRVLSLAGQNEGVTSIIIAYHDKGYMHDAGARTSLPPCHCFEYYRKMRPETEMPNHSDLGR